MILLRYGIKERHIFRILQLLLLFIYESNGRTTSYKVERESNFKSDKILTNKSKLHLDDFECRSKGLFPDPGSCFCFFRCDDNQYGYISSSYNCCPEGTVFNNNLNRCSPYSMISNSNPCLNHSSTIENIHSHIRQKRKITSAQFFDGAGAIGSIIGAAAGIAKTIINSKKPIADLSGIKNKLTGIEGKLKDIDASITENMAENKIKMEIIQALVREEMEYNQLQFSNTQNLIHEGRLQSRIDSAITQGLIIQTNAVNDANFKNVYASMTSLQRYIGEETKKIQENIQTGFNSVLDTVEKSRIEPLVSELLISIDNFQDEVIKLENLSEADKKDEIERENGFLDYLESNSLDKTLYDIIQQGFAIPISVSDTSALSILDLLVTGLQIHTSMLKSVVASNVYLAGKKLEARDLNRFNFYINQVSSSISMLKLNLGYNRNQGILTKVRSVIHQIKLLPFSTRIYGLDELLAEKENILEKIQTDVNQFIDDNEIMAPPEPVRGKFDFSLSSASLPIGPWNKDSQVSYAFQFISKQGISAVGRWSNPPYTVLANANPIIRLPFASEGVTRLVYRKFDMEKPELVAVITDSSQETFRDIGKDLITAVSMPNEQFAMKDTSILLKDGADVNIALAKHLSPLHYAAENGNVEVMEILCNAFADVNAKSIDNVRPIHHAALFGEKEGIEFLISRGADLNVQTASLYWSPLHVAVANGNTDATLALLRNGAFVNIKDNEGLTPLHISIFGYGETLNNLINDDGIDVNIKANDGQTPLHFAARSTNDYFVKELVKVPEININAQTNDGLTPLHYSAMTGNVQILKELINKGAIITLADQQDSTPLHYAAFYGNKECAIILLRKDYTLKAMENSYGKTAYDLAVENNWKEISQILRNETEYMINKIREENEAQAKNQSITDKSVNIDESLITSNYSYCLENIEQTIAKHSEEVCVYIDEVKNYVNTIKSISPHFYNEKDNVIINTFNHRLGKVKESVKVWEGLYGNLQKVKDTFSFAKNFESTFDLMHRNKQRRDQFIVQNSDHEKVAAGLKEEIKRAQQEVDEIVSIIGSASGDTAEYLGKTILNLKKSINDNVALLSINPTVMNQLEEVLIFLKYIKEIVENVKQLALEANHNATTYKNEMILDKSIFEINQVNVREHLERLQEEIFSEDKTLLSVKTALEKLKPDLNEQISKIHNFYNQYFESHEYLREKRRELLRRIQNTAALAEFINVLSTPVEEVIEASLLEAATPEERKDINKWVNNIKHFETEITEIKKIIESKKREIGMTYDIIFNKPGISYAIKRELEIFYEMDLDLQRITYEMPLLDLALAHISFGLQEVERTFGSYAQEIDKIIENGKAVNTDEDYANALSTINQQIMNLRCEWRDTQLFIMNSNECKKQYSILE